MKKHSLKQYMSYFIRKGSTHNRKSRIKRSKCQTEMLMPCGYLCGRQGEKKIFSSRNLTALEFLSGHYFCVCCYLQCPGFIVCGTFLLLTSVRLRQILLQIPLCIRNCSRGKVTVLFLMQTSQFSSSIKMIFSALRYVMTPLR